MATFFWEMCTAKEKNKTQKKGKTFFTAVKHGKQSRKCVWNANRLEKERQKDGKRRKKNSNIDNCPRSFIRQNVVEVVVAKKILMANIVIAGDFAALPVDSFFSHSALIFAFSFNFNFHFDSLELDWMFAFAYSIRYVCSTETQQHITYVQCA